jgi:endonuclease-3
MKERTREVFSKLMELHPDAKTDLEYESALDLLVAIILSAQTSDKAVNESTRDLFKAYRTASDYSNSDEKDIERMISKLGLQRRRAHLLRKLGSELEDKHGGEIPQELTELIKLPGIGRKTAEVFLSVWSKQRHFAVDTHISRVAKRLKFAFKKDTVLAVEKKMSKHLGKERDMVQARYSMLEFAKKSCTAKNPKCEGCPLREFCRYPHHMFDKK